MATFNDGETVSQRGSDGIVRKGVVIAGNAHDPQAPVLVDWTTHPPGGHKPSDWSTRKPLLGDLDSD